MAKGHTIVLTADRSQMSNFRGNFLFGFLSCGPYKHIPRFAYDYLLCPTVKFNQTTGEAEVAPLGLRRVESALADEFGKEAVFVAHPDMIEKAVGEETKVVGLSEMDPRGIGPVTSALSWSNAPWNLMLFNDLTDRLKRLKKRYGFKTVLGGAGAWQFEEPEMRREYGLDHVVKGEVDDTAGRLFHDIMNDSADGFIHVPTRRVENIPLIRGPTVTSLIEAMRGCGRGCDFCDPNLRMKRDFPVERVVEEARVNAEYGFRAVWLHSEELLLYGCSNRDMIPNRDAIVELYRELLSIPNIARVGATHWTLAGVAAAPEVIADLSKLNHMGPDRWLGIQPGLETASPSLMRRHAVYKSKPFTPEEYPYVIRESIRIMNRNYFYPACTLIIGLPGETDDDVQQTIDVVEELKQTHCILAPLLYVDYWRPERSSTFDSMTLKQWELYYKCWVHNVRQFDRKIWQATQHFDPIIRFVTVVLTKWATRRVLRFLRDFAKSRFRSFLDFL